MSTISSATAKDPLDGSEYIPISGTPKKKISVTSIANYVISLFTNKATVLDLLTVSDSNLQFNSTDVNKGFRKLTFSGKSADFSQLFDASTKIVDVVYLENSGTPSVKIGTTNGGTEIAEIEVVSDSLTVNINKYFSSSLTLYFGVSGGNVDIVVSYYKFWI